MADTKLKPCPFCGSSPEIIAYDPWDGYQGNNTTYKVVCYGCGAELKKPTKELATEAWNRRVSDG